MLTLPKRNSGKHFDWIIRSHSLPLLSLVTSSSYFLTITLLSKLKKYTRSWSVVYLAEFTCYSAQGPRMKSPHSPALQEEKQGYRWPFLISLSISNFPLDFPSIQKNKYFSKYSRNFNLSYSSFSKVYVVTIETFTICTTASNTAHPFWWGIFDYFVLNFLVSTKQKTEKMFNKTQNICPTIPSS